MRDICFSCAVLCFVATALMKELQRVPEISSLMHGVMLQRNSVNSETVLTYEAFGREACQSVAKSRSRDHESYLLLSGSHVGILYAKYSKPLAQCVLKAA